MTGQPTIRLSVPADRDTVLRFIAEMGFNPRDAVTWDGLRMQAMTAWLDANLIGAIPLEPRLIQAGDGTLIKAVHETVVAVRPEFRGTGIGSQLQQAIFDSPPGGAAAATVFREEPQSPAYRWYLRNGFSPAMRVSSCFCDEPARDVSVVTRAAVMDVSDPRVNWKAMTAAWEKSYGTAAGVVNRASRPLRDWLAVHPYRGRYVFKIVMHQTNADEVSYALLGVGTLHSQTTRVDVLEFCAPGGSNVEMKLLRGIITFAGTNGFRPVRWPLTDTDPHIALATAHQFEKRWSFDMLIRPLANVIPKDGENVSRDTRRVAEDQPNARTPCEFMDLNSLRYISIDYT